MITQLFRRGLLLGALCVANSGSLFLHAQEGEAVPPARAGTVVVWGTSQLNSIPERVSNVRSMAMATAHALAVKYDGSVVAWGIPGYTNVPANITNVVQVAVADEGRSAALLADGTVRVWKDRQTIALAVPNFPPVTAIALGEYRWLDPGFLIGLTAEGSIVASVDQMQQPQLTNVTAIAAGKEHALALMEDGTVAGWSDAPGNLAAHVPPGLANVVLVRALQNQSAALQADGTLVMWGVLPAGITVPLIQVGGNIVDFALSQSGVVVLKSDGTVTAYGHRPLPELTGATSLASSPRSVGAIVPKGLSAPIITRVPPAGTHWVLEGNNFHEKVDASGTGLLSFQWYQDGEAIPGQTSSNLFLRVLTSADAGEYTMRVTDVTGFRETEPFSIAVGNSRIAPLQGDAAQEHFESGTFGFTIYMAPEKKVQAIQTSTDLQSWSDITNTPAKDGNWPNRYVLKGLAADEPRMRFYRVVVAD